MAHSVAARVRVWAKRLLLGEWKITVAGAPEDGSRASCEANPEYKEATISLDTDRIPPEEMDGYIVHELLHCYTWRLEALAEEWGKGESRYAYVRDVAETTVTDLERAILNIARRK